MRLAILLRAIRPIAVSGPVDREIEGVVCDSRQVRPGYLFVAVRGEARDGWEFVGDAVGRGAVAVVSERTGPLRGEATHIRVSDARLALALLAAEFHQHPADRLQLAGVTGTNGKTTTAYMLRNMLQAAGRSPGLISTVTYEIGQRSLPASRTTPEAPMLQALLAQMVGAGCRSVVMEVSSHAVVQHRIAGVDFDVGIFTNLSREHLDYHVTMEAYFEAKAQFMFALGSGRKPAVAIVNADDAWGQRLLKRPELRARVLTFGLTPQADVAAEAVAPSAEGVAFIAHTPWGTAHLRLRLLGHFNVQNALAAMAAGGALGLELDQMIGVLKNMAPAPGRLEEFPSSRGFRVYVDYAHTPDALEQVLTTLRETTAGQLILVFGCGGNRDVSKREPMGRVACRLADYSILTSDNPRKESPADIIAQIQKGFAGADNYEIIEDRRLAIRRAIRRARQGDVVLVAGKGHETTQEFANTIIPFDDRKVVAEELEAL